ncbi:MAG: hypothetical protein A2W05_00720 [Candidatus Schekmanbacteria bacterium RBG_16_38_10]|uniref:Phosphoenolpyruvate carboxykinase n=1 Tax=Candidatus Schekmanbacteria bacterium RBG_16_38_10 TaxID=1817879 RepID=A0A1F7RM90_9BACT|nr:MAG: hypothetical protein A2W05_00720 [Candidatus Schekmanbacteria bacterium RBG_16_38_10]
MKGIKLKIADIIIEVYSESTNLVFPEDEAYKRFVVKSGEPNLFLKTHYGEIPEFELGREIFNSGGVWKLFSNGTNFIFTLTTPPGAQKPYSVAVVDKDFSRGEIYLSPSNSSSPYALNPLAYPLDEVLMVSILSRGNGILLHSNCIEDKGSGMLFTGISGAGKSTMAQIWQGRNGVKVLTDERVIIRKENNSFYAYGTPWHGTAKIHSPDRAVLNKIFFITHGKENSAMLLSKVDAASRLIVRAFPTYWDSAGMEYTLDFASKIVGNIPCYELPFKPDESIINFVRGIE